MNIIAFAIQDYPWKKNQVLSFQNDGDTSSEGSVEGEGEEEDVEGEGESDEGEGGEERPVSNASSEVICVDDD